MIDGKMKRIAGWIKQRQNGENFLSLAISDPKPATTPMDQPAKKAAPDSDIPF